MQKKYKKIAQRLVKSIGEGCNLHGVDCHGNILAISIELELAYLDGREDLRKEHLENFEKIYPDVNKAEGSQS